MHAGKLHLSPKIEISGSPTHGRGIFANAPIRAGELLEESHFAIIDSTVATVDRGLYGYVYTWPKGGDHLAIVFGYAMVYNHSTDPNVTWQTDEGAWVYRFIALRDIAAGEELVHDYGDHAEEEFREMSARAVPTMRSPARSAG